MGQHHDVTFPNETEDYRAARDRLLDEEIALRRQAEKVAELRRALPLGGALKDAYVFQDLAGADVPIGELFTDVSPSLMVYGFMYRPGADACPACTSLLDALNGAAPHIARKLNLAVVAKETPDVLAAWSESRGWSNLRLLSSAGSSFNVDYRSEDDEGRQWPIINVFRKTGETIVHTWASELFFAAPEAGQHPRHADQIWPLWSVHDLTADGRPADWFPATRYD